MKQYTCFGEFAKYTSLNVLGMLGLSCYILADTFFVSKGLGTNGLAALNLAIPVYSFIHGSGLMLGMGGGTKYSIFRGQQASEPADRVFTNTVFLAMIFAVCFMLTGFLFAEKLTLLLGAEGEVAAMTQTYLTVILLFSPAFLMNDILTCFVRNDGNPRLSMLAMLGGSLSNILLDYIFIFPFRMGILGAVLATGAAPVIGMLLLSSHWFQKRNGFHFRRSKPQLPIISSCISLGFSSLVTEVASGIVIIIFNAIILSISGTVGVAAYGVIANLALVVTAVFNGIAQGMQPLISRAYGTNDTRRIKQNLRYGIITGLLLSGIIYLTAFLFADPITDIFNNEGNAQLQQIATSGIKLYFTATPFIGFNIIISFFFTSMERAVPAQLISIMRGLVLVIPMAFLLSNLAGLTGIWLTVPLTEGLVCGISLILSVIYLLQMPMHGKEAKNENMNM